MIHSYPSIYNVGHKAVEDLTKGLVRVEEKVDGSQFSFCVNDEGVLEFRSKNNTIHESAPEKMFAAAVESVRVIKRELTPGFVYRAEYLSRPKHNTIAYERVPVGHLVLYDVQTGDEAYMDRSELEDEGKRIGLEVVPLIFAGLLTLEDAHKLLDRTSFLGGAKIEGLVIKQATVKLFGADKKALMAKFVSPEFREMNQKAFSAANPKKNDMIAMLIERFGTEARWKKAAQHLRDDGKLENAPKDIGLLIKEIQADTEKDSTEFIKDALFGWAWPQIARGIVRGAPEWYKNSLLESQFTAQGVVGTAVGLQS